MKSASIRLCAAALIIVAALLGCSGRSALTSGSSSDESAKPGIPLGRVMVANLQGDRQLARLTKVWLVEGLKARGFYVPSDAELDSAYDRALQLDLSGDDYFKTLRAMNVDAVMFGAVNFKVGFRATAVLTLELYDPRRGGGVWAAMIADPRLISFSTDVEASARRAVGEALDRFASAFRPKP